VSGDSARISVTVALRPELAFEMFTADIDRWWRHGIKYRHSGSSNGLICMETGVGGRLFESFEQGGICSVIEVGRVRIWEPPHRLNFSWRNANFAPHENTEVDVRFAATTSGTLVTVMHSGFESLRSDHPARHALQGAEFSRMIGLWWGEQMTSLRRFCAARTS
jgi:uncharacterized protein YndB with AHSA1/START domain